MSSNLESIIKLIIISIFLLFIYYLKKERSNPILEKWFFNFKIRIDNPFFTLLIPILIMVVLQTFWSGVRGEDIHPFLALLTNVLVQPFFEEYIWRGLVFGFFITLSAGHAKVGKSVIILAGLIIQTVSFMYWHGHGFHLPLLVDGFIFGLLFIASKRNLVPCTVAHMTNNFLVFILTN